MDSPLSSTSGTPESDWSDRVAPASDAKYDNDSFNNEGDVEDIKDEDIIAVVGTTIVSGRPTDPADQKPSGIRFNAISSLANDVAERFTFQVDRRPAYLKSLDAPGLTDSADIPTLYILISTLSGVQLAAEFFDNLLYPLLWKIGFKKGSHTVIWTSNADSVKNFAKEVLFPNAIRGYRQTVLMLSGDGGTVDIINELYESKDGYQKSSYVKPTLCLFPLGTGNALYHSIHRPHALPSIYIQSLRTFLTGTPVPLPTYRATFSPGARILSNQGQTQAPIPNNVLYGAVVASYGFHATLVADSDTPEYRKHGDKRFGMVANELLNPDEGKSLPHAYKAEVKAGSEDGALEVIGDGEHGYVLATLVSNLERTFTVSPESSKQLNGQLRLVQFGALDGNGVMKVMGAAYQKGSHVQLPEVLYRQINTLQINFKENGEDWKWRRCCIDGKIVGIEENGWMKVEMVNRGEEAVDVVISGITSEAEAEPISPRPDSRASMVERDSMEEDSLPLPKLAWNASTDSFSHERSRKRVRITPPPPSSDPPLFSSDDDPSVDNYTGGRRKRQFRGPWYDPQPTTVGNKKQRNFKRQYDSGVFLGSDGTDMDDGMDESESVYANLALRQWNSSQNTVKQEPTAEDLVRQHIELCLENGNETIDLSFRSLTTLSNETIRPLSAFTRLPPVIEDVFEKLEPRLKIFLASNNLTTLPEELFNLDRLTVLSLRGNKIYELPSAIGRLRKLRELNLSQNGLQHLPYEILDLFSIDSRLESFQIHPNQFYEPQLPPSKEIEEEDEVPQYKIGLGNRSRPRAGAICGIVPDLSGRRWHPQWRARYKARTEISYLDINGAHLQGPDLSRQAAFGSRQFPDGIPMANVADIPKSPPVRGGPVSRAPSLLEVALNACIRNPDLPRLHAMLPDPHPPYFPTLLAKVNAKKESGDTNCTICKRSFIVARTEWIEWWEISKAEEHLVSAASPLREMENERDVLERMVPLMRRGCSWLCVP